MGFIGMPLARQARWIEEAFYLLWRQGASVAILLQIVDQAYDREHPDATLQSGVFFANGDPKPSFTAVRFPFVGDRAGKRSVRVWGKAPVSGTPEVRVHFSLMADQLWPDIPDEQRWAIDLMEERLQRTRQTPAELSARAEKLRTEAAETDIPGFRDAALALAQRYEEVASARLASA